jgi:hypothetical protein
LMPYTPLQVSSFYTDFLQDVPQEIALAIVPTGRQEDKRYMYYQTLHERRMTGGVVSRAEADTFDFVHSHNLLRAGAVDLPPTAMPRDISNQLASLAELNIGFFIIDKTLLYSNKTAEHWRLALPLIPAFEDELLLVYRTTPEEGRDYQIKWRFEETVALINAQVTHTAENEENTALITLGWVLLSEVGPGLVYEVTFSDSRGTLMDTVQEEFLLALPVNGASAGDIFVTQDMITFQAPMEEFSTFVTVYSQGSKRLPDALFEVEMSTGY